MPLDWESFLGSGRGAYADWEALNWRRDGRRWWPVFLDWGGQGDPVAAIDAIEAVAGLLFPRTERAWLATVRDMAARGESVPALRTMVYVPEFALPDLPGYWRVLHVAPPVGLDPGAPASATAPPIPAPRGSAGTGKPVFGIVDDTIGYLNRNFRDGTRTRIRGLWQQARQPMRGTDPAEVVLGRVLSGEDIDAMIAAGGDEAHRYAADSAALSPVPQPQIMRRRLSHGTLVLDIAAGPVDPLGEADDVGSVPIWAVQLPTFAVTDTSGRRLEPQVALGLRWLVTSVIASFDGGPAEPLVVNLSLGSLAGPGNETAFLSDTIAHEIARYEHFTGAPMRVVAAYGNARRSDLVARQPVSGRTELDLQWQVPPDDRTSTYLELRARDLDPAALSIEVTPPGAEVPLSVAWPEPGSGWKDAAGTAMVLGEDDGSVLIALAPTVAEETFPRATPGPWRVRVIARAGAENGPSPLIKAQVQRDETPQGHWLRGRQSWLDHAAGRDWSPVSRDWGDPATDNPVRYDGTGVAFSHMQDDRVYFVGAMRPKTGEQSEVSRRYVPALYSAEGAGVARVAPESDGPDVSAMSEEGRFLAGWRGAGMLSGTTVRASGTSMAAPMVARRLLRFFICHADPHDRAEELRAVYGAGIDPCDLPEKDPQSGRATLRRRYP